MILILILLSVFKLNAQSLNYVWTSYDTSSTINTKRFSSLTAIEVNLSNSVEDFADNRARLTLMNNNKLVSPSDLKGPDIPIYCQCFLTKDTITITTALGFFSGFGIVTAIHKDRFAASFFSEADDMDVFKSMVSDTAYTDKISVATDEQQLTLFNKPSFKDNETIIGKFEGQFKPFYELGADVASPAKSVMKASLFFKCKVRSVTN